MVQLKTLEPERPERDDALRVRALIGIIKSGDDRGLSVAQIKARLTCDDETAQRVVKSLIDDKLLTTLKTFYAGRGIDRYFPTLAGRELARAKSVEALKARKAWQAERVKRADKTDMAALKMRIVDAIRMLKKPATEAVVANRLRFPKGPVLTEAFRQLVTEARLKAHRPGAIKTHGQRANSNRSWVYTATSATEKMKG